MVSSGVTPPPILVIGMHRSGMSATTGLLAHLGVYLGDPERLQSGDVHNSEWYDELRDAVALNDRLLDWCGSAWDLPPELGDPHCRQLQPPPDLFAQLKSLVASMDAEAAAVGRPWAVKDPRLSVLWPYWFEAKPTARVVLCMRDPAAIAQSLKNRNGLSLRFGLKLSEQYFEHLLRIPKERIEAQVRYEELVSDPENVARDLMRNLCLESDIDRTRMAVSSVKAELARNRGRLESMTASIDSHSISQAYARMLAHGPAPAVEPVNPLTLAAAPTSPPAGVAFERRVAVPPRELQDWVGGGGPAVFKATGDEFLGYLVDLCGLQPGDAVLDVGCGSGRMALPLAGYLNRDGRYAGFDVSAEAIAWCAENISGSHPNFNFTVVDIQNGAYNPTGTYKSSEFRFPYPDESFDVVLLASLFTHMLPSDVEHYLHEIVRVLKPGGRSLITFFLLNEESSALITEGKSYFDFEHEMPGYRMNHAENPEAAIAYPEAFVRWLYGECGLELREPLRYGTWCGRTNGMSGQDVVIAVKPARLGQTGGIDSIDPDPTAELGRQAAAAGVGTASLDGVPCQASSTSAATTPVEVSRLNAGAPRLILAGHSHLRAIAGRSIISESPELVAGPHGDGTLIMVGPGPKRDMSYFDTLADLARGADVGILWNGNEHNTLYLLEAETPFDFLSAHVRKMNPSAQMKPRAAIRDRFRQLSIDVLDVVLTRLATGGLNRIALIGTPPPKGDNEALRALLQAEEFFVHWAAQLGHSVETVPITDPYVRLKLWYLLQDMLAEEARIRGLMFIPVPEEVQDADGFLKREFWQDVTHANRAYGNVMYETVLRAFE